MPVSSEHRMRVLRHMEIAEREGLVPTGARTEYGRTAADVLRYIDNTSVVLLAVTVGKGEVVFLTVRPAAIKASIAAYRAAEPMPCAWHSGTKILMIGSFDAIRHAEQS